MQFCPKYKKKSENLCPKYSRHNFSNFFFIFHIFILKFSDLQGQSSILDKNTRYQSFKKICHHKFSIWLIGLFNVNWVFFQMYFLFSFQQRCKTVKLDLKPLQSGQTLKSTHKNWQMQVSTTEVLYVLARGHSQSTLTRFCPFFHHLTITFVQGSPTTNYVVYELPLINLNSTFFSELPIIVGTSE